MDMHRQQFRQGFIRHINVLLADVSFLYFTYPLNTSHVSQMEKGWCLPVALCPNTSSSEGPYAVHAYLENKVIRFPPFTVLVFELAPRAFSNIAINEHNFQWIGIQFFFFFSMRNSWHLFNITIFFFTICILLLWFLDTFLLYSLICILLLILFTCFIICCFLNIGLILSFFLCRICQRECFWNPVSCSFIWDKNFLLVIWDILFYVPLCNVFLALLYEYFSALFLFLFVSKSVGPLPCRGVEFVWKPVYSLSWTMKWYMSLCVAIDSHILQLVFSMTWPTSAKLRPKMQNPWKQAQCGISGPPTIPTS